MLALFMVAAVAFAGYTVLSDPRQSVKLLSPLTPISSFQQPPLTAAPRFTQYLPPLLHQPQLPLSHESSDHNIFRLHGELSHYFPNPSGFGVDEYPLPDGAKITHLHMLHRHGARYPTSDMSTVGKLESHNFKAKGDLEFLNKWENKLGLHVLVPLGKQELFDSGALHKKMYGFLYPTDGSKIVARSTTQNRMTESAEYFLKGFFGENWTNNVTLQLIVEGLGFNNSLAAYFKCPNNGVDKSKTGTTAKFEWAEVYLADAEERLNKLITFDDSDTKLTNGDIYNFQRLCAYETVALGHSDFCDLFTYEEWQGYEYSIDIQFSGNCAFQSPSARGLGIGYVQELRARLKHQYLTKNGGAANITLDSSPETFPLNQTLYLDFSHDTNIMAILVAMGLTQFNKHLPETHQVDHDLVVSHLTPFAARLDMEIISAPRPLSASRSGSAKDYESKAEAGENSETTYIHFLLNERTVPLGRSFKQCGDRDDGWCELGAFLDATDSAYEDSNYEYSCFADYPVVPYGTITNGVPVERKG